jgi:hypothetical protein
MDVEEEIYSKGREDLLTRTFSLKDRDYSP